MSTRLGLVHAFIVAALTTLLVMPAIALPCSSVRGASAVSTISGADATKLGAIELRFFAHPYEHDNLNKRLSRVEGLMFGTANSVASENERMTRIVSTLNAAASEVKFTRRHSLKRSATAANPFSCGYIQSTYPSVSELEVKVFSLTFAQKPVNERLQNLEIRVFGKPSSEQDLSCRVDALNNYVNATVSTPNKNIPFSWLYNFVDPSMLPQRVHATTIVDRIETMETSLFGKTCTGKTLEKRVGALEKNILGIADVHPVGRVQAQAQGQDLSVRVAQLWTHIQSAKSSKASQS